MNIVSTSILFLTAVNAVAAIVDLPPTQSPTFEYNECASKLWSNLEPSLCMVASGEGRYSDVKLGKASDCSLVCPPDEDGLMRIDGTNLCLQASHGSGSGSHASGSHGSGGGSVDHSYLMDLSNDPPYETYHYGKGKGGGRMLRPHDPYSPSGEGSYDSEPNSSSGKGGKGSYSSSGKGGKGSYSSSGKGGHYSSSSSKGGKGGKGSNGGTLNDGNKMRVYPCDRENKLQQFDMYSWEYDGILMLKAEKHDHLCITNRGEQATEEDPVILKDCDGLHPEVRKYWHHGHD